MIKGRLFILLALATLASSNITPRNKLEEGLLKVIEKWTEGEVSSLPISLPRLPVTFEPNHYKYDGYKLSLAEAKVWGLEQLRVTRLTASRADQTMSIDFTIPSIAVVSDWYRFTGKFLFFKIDNQGKFRVDVKDLKVTAHLEFAAQGSNTVVKKLDLDYTVEKLRVRLSGCPRIVVNRLNQRVWKLLTKKNHDLMNKMKRLVIEAANDHLQGHTPDQLVTMISSV